MANQVFNIARGRIGYYATQAGVGNAAFIVVLLKATEADDTLNNYDDLATLIAAAGNTECDFTNYARKTITTVTPDLNDTANTLDEAIGNLVYAAAGGAANNNIVKILVCFDADTTAGTDSNVIPLTHHDASVTTDGSALTFTEHADGFWGSA